MKLFDDAVRPPLPRPCTDLRESDVTIDDLSGSTRDLAEIVGMEMLFEILDRLGGNTLYLLNKKTLLRGTRDRLIREQFDGGNFRQLARRYRMSVRQVRNICKEEQKCQ